MPPKTITAGPRPVAPTSAAGRPSPARTTALAILLLLGGGAVGAAGYLAVSGDWQQLTESTGEVTLPIPPRSGPEDRKASLLTPPPAPAAPANRAPTAGGPPPISPPGLPNPGPAAATPSATLGEPPPPPQAQPSRPEAPAAAAPAPAIAVPAMPSPGEAATPSFAAIPARGDAKPLPDAPLAVLQKRSPYGMLPAIAADGRQSWQVYARPFNGEGAKPRIAVIVTDLGLSKEATEAAIQRLPADVTLAFNPYAANLDQWVKKARAAGHEVMMSLPMEPADFPASDPGPYTLLSTVGADENIARLQKVMSRTGGYVGLAAQPSTFAASPHFPRVMAALRDAGVAYVGSGDIKGPPGAAVTTVADETPFRAAIDARLAQTLASARKDGKAVVLAGPNPVSYERLNGWLAALPKNGAQLAPASAVVKPAAAP